MKWKKRVWCCTFQVIYSTIYSFIFLVSEFSEILYAIHGNFPSKKNGAKSKRNFVESSDCFWNFIWWYHYKIIRIATYREKKTFQTKWNEVFTSEHIVAKLLLWAQINANILCGWMNIQKERIKFQHQHRIQNLKFRKESSLKYSHSEHVLILYCDWFS